MKTFRSLAVLGAMLAPALLWGQTVTSDSSNGFEADLSGSGYAAFVSGNKGRFEQDQQQSRNGSVGIDSLHLSKDLSSSTNLTIDSVADIGNSGYKIDANLSNPDLWHVDVGYRQFRTWYDASGGYFPAAGTWLPVDGDKAYVDRGHLWVELGLTPADAPQWMLRYDLATRQGTKDSTEWADVTIPGYGTRNIVPTLLRLNEHTHTVKASVSRATEEQSWGLDAQYQNTSINDQKLIDRGPTTSANRDTTDTTLTTSDMFTTSGHYARKLSQRLTFTTGAMASTLDTHLNGGSRIFGSVFDTAFSPTYANRSAHDEGYYALEGGANLKDYVGNINLDFRPNQDWQVTGAFRMEDTQTSDSSTYVTTNVAVANGPVSQTDESGLSTAHWLDTAEQIEATYTGRPDWTLTLRGDLDQGTGNLVQDSIDLDTASSTAHNNTNYNQYSEKYTATANWYARPGLTVVFQGYYRLVDDKYVPIQDSSPNNYPVYIVAESIATNDLNARVTWRPEPLLSFTTRYDFQRSAIRDSMEGLGSVDSSRYTSNIVSETVTTNPLPRLYLVASVNVAFNQLTTPATGATVVKNGDSNYVDGSVGAGYALSKIDDLDLDYSMYTADNFVNDSATTLPYGGAEHENNVSMTWIRRQSARLVYTLKLTYATYRDGALGGMDNYTGEIVYAKVQYRF